ncbi:cobalt-precorrin-6A reductase [Tropicimonas marinistellae]|uniref:cobalt-precorrin-6A reductase n=1 Tax=Tropicimonas marinistellae TaxID=1739787 RepID=UPI0008344E4A|nr:cobalt-precorrin-6A reductase [Tropicimonas marinistellae]
MNARVLILGGTSEARELAEALAARDIDTVTALAGASGRASGYAGDVRIGGFGGAAGLADYLAAQDVSALVDATHPFAATISGHAAAAARLSGCPTIRLDRPAWTEPSGAGWQQVATLAQAVSRLPSGARAFMATGKGSAGVLSNRADVTFVLRSIAAVPDLPTHVEPVLAHPPFSEDAEHALFASMGITHLVTKNSGGASGRSKLDAAAALGLPVIMVVRPPAPIGVASVSSVAEALDWLEQTLALDTSSGPTP